ncbi:50S ribosomal protein L11 methyltransferase [Paraphotobacterium marinum]|uniref:Ribosomal protein L11 methyltransferase n=1 Tax=Paraphotobacterium marinum TaxID=1755811 RepID=A0A220VE94_9GAMM|nr:50S ribosomal protein L11 methyltransferase [Paraphotobacterium marinum]ASK78243.1 50S ribosomal protein L11 methyltransferase [Paraphotobacterium marinum]
MSWIQLRINTNASIAEKLGDFLFEQTDVHSITYLDAKDTPIFEPLPGETLLWNETDVLALYDANTNTLDLIELIRASEILQSSFQYKIEILEDKDWIREWMDSFVPLELKNNLWIIPSWHSAPETNSTNIFLDPGLAFGTGTHATTQLCLNWLSSQNLQDKLIIDFGCGSGILAIAALKLGAKKVIGIDIDPQALQASRANAKKNQVEENFDLYLPKDLPENITADVLIANILAEPLRALSQQIIGMVKLDGNLGLSGILDTQVDNIKTYYTDNVSFDKPDNQGEWVLLSGKKYK